MNINNTYPSNFVGNQPYPATPMPGFAHPFQHPGSLGMPNNTFLPQFPPDTPIHVQLANLYQSKRMMLSQKESYENYLKMTNENLDKLQTRIQELENSEELPVSVVMQKAFEALNNNMVTEEMKVAFEALKKACIK